MIFNTGTFGYNFNGVQDPELFNADADRFQLITDQDLDSDSELQILR